MLKRLFASYQRPCFAEPSRWDTLSLDLSGNSFEITLPPQDYDFPEEERGQRFNLFDNKWYDYNTKPHRNGYPAHNEGVSRPGLFRRNWNTYGPIWDMGFVGKLQCAAVVCDTSRMPFKLNCFNPEQMERLIIHGLYYDKGPGFGNGSNEFDTPVNWRIKNIQGVEWVYLESWGRRPAWNQYATNKYESYFSVRLVTPLFADKYLLVSFSATGSLPAEPSNQLMLKRIEQIIPSLRLKLSPEAQKQQMEARQVFPTARYSQQRSPEAWQYYGSHRKGDLSKGEKPNIFEGPCSPPPELY
ncbi:MAG TPA: hypothetical protein VN030_12915 [Cellvibrio sp.]|nr:hypothetical protein [Cellvibrio sp.]